jgi:flagellar export protein FliJ
MTFRFSLETILRLRRSLEHREEQLLAAMENRVQSVATEIAAIDAQLSSRDRDREQGLRSGVSGAQLHFELDCRRALESRRGEIAAILRLLEQARDRQRSAFLESRQRRQALEHLRERALREFRTDEDRRQQRQLDDLYLMRREFSKRG